MKRTNLYIIYIVIVAAAYCALCHFTPIRMNDDLLYKFVWPQDNESFTQPIRTLHDVAASQVTHYSMLNGRSIVHFFVQLFDGILGKEACCLASALMLGAFVYLVALYTGRRDKLLACTVVTFAMFVLMPGFHNEFLLFVGIFNYLWVSTITMLFVTLVTRYKDRPLTGRALAMSALSFFAGWLHEGITLPVLLTLAVYCLRNRRDILKRPVLYCTVFYALGTAVCILSPGTMHRIGSGGGTGVGQYAVHKLAIAAVCMSKLRLSYILLAASALARFRCRELWRQHLGQYKYFYMAWVFAFIPVFGSDTTETRAFFYPECIAAVILCHLAVLYCSSRRTTRRVLVRALNTVTLIVYCVVMACAVTNYCNYKYIVQQLEDPSVAVVAVPHMTAADNTFIAGYIQEAVKFGTFENAQAFVHDDTHITCLKVLYGRKVLRMLPADMVRRLSKGGINENSFVYDDSRNIMAVRMKEAKGVHSVTLCLKPEDADTLPLTKRLSAYRGNTYSVPALRFDTLSVNSRHYLLICCPTNNIKRRIAKIAYRRT